MNDVRYMMAASYSITVPAGTTVLKAVPVGTGRRTIADVGS